MSRLTRFYLVDSSDNWNQVPIVSIGAGLVDGGRVKSRNSRVERPPGSSNVRRVLTYKPGKGG